MQLLTLTRMTEPSERRRPRRSGPVAPPEEGESPSRPAREITPAERIDKLRAIWGED